LKRGGNLPLVIYQSENDKICPKMPIGYTFATSCVISGPVICMTLAAERQTATQVNGSPFVY
jgi:hypothetical protein